jgi:hypothetical protein
MYELSQVPFYVGRWFRWQRLNPNYCAMVQQEHNKYSSIWWKNMLTMEMCLHVVYVCWLFLIGFMLLTPKKMAGTPNKFHVSIGQFYWGHHDFGGIQHQPYTKAKAQIPNAALCRSNPPLASLAETSRAEQGWMVLSPASVGTWGWVKTYYYHIWWNNHSLISYFRVPGVPGFWLIVIYPACPLESESFIWWITQHTLGFNEHLTMKTRDLMLCSPPNMRHTVIQYDSMGVKMDVNSRLINW